MKPRVLFALIVLAACWVTIMMVQPVVSDQGQQQVLAIGIDRSDGNIQGSIMAVVPNANVGHDPDILNNACFTFIPADNNSWNDPGTKTAPVDMNKGVLANAGASDLGINEAVCIIVTIADDNMARNVPIDKAVQANEEAVCIISGGQPDGGQAQIMANTSASILGLNDGNILTS